MLPVPIRKQDQWNQSKRDRLKVPRSVESIKKGLIEGTKGGIFDRGKRSIEEISVGRMITEKKKNNSYLECW